MRDVLLIDTKKRILRHSRVRPSLLGREYNLFITDSSRRALEMLATAVIDAVVINLSGPGEDATGIVEQITAAHPGITILFLSASEVEQILEKKSRYRGLIDYLREYVQTKEAQPGRGAGFPGSIQSSTRGFDGGLLLDQGGVF